ncbi:MAG: hypothetical protein ACK5MT_05470 [Actinomycetales bacterium]
MPRRIATTAAAALLIAGVGTPASGNGITPPSVLGPGQALPAGESMLSANAQHRLRIGEFTEEYGTQMTTLNGDEFCLWEEMYSYATTTQRLDETLVMQTDGNLVAYVAGSPVWASWTQGNPGAYLVLQDDENLVIYSAADQPLWQSGWTCSIGYTSAELTGDPVPNRLGPGQYMQSPKRGYRLMMQGDGNLVLYSPAGRAIWATWTQGHPGAILARQVDGNLVVYSPEGTVLWALGIRGDYEDTWLTLQDDGNLVYLWGDTVKWASNTVGQR